MGEAQPTHAQPGRDTRLEGDWGSTHGFPADRPMGLPGRHPIRRFGAPRLGHLCLHFIAAPVRGKDTHRGSCGDLPSNLEARGDPHKGAGYDYLPSPSNDTYL